MSETRLGFHIGYTGMKPMGDTALQSEDRWLHEFKSYADGRYINWPEILAIYPKYEALFKQGQTPD